MTGLVMDSVPTPVELDSWGQWHFILPCLGMLQTKFYLSKLKNVILATKIIAKPSLHLQAA